MTKQNKSQSLKKAAKPSAGSSSAGKVSAGSSSASSSSASTATHGAHQVDIDRLFRQLGPTKDGTIAIDEMESILLEAGLWANDPRLSNFHEALKAEEGSSNQESSQQGKPKTKAPSKQKAQTKAKPSKKGRINKTTFKRAVGQSAALIERALRGDLVIPDFRRFAEKLQACFDEAGKNKGGKVADYIPQLAQVSKDKFGMAVCTVDGQRYATGDSAEQFSIQSCSKPLNYLLALDEHGVDKVHQHIGREPSGQSFNQITLDRLGRPHNPLINAGAIMSASLVRQDLDPSARFEHVLQTWTRAIGVGKPVFNNTVYLSERQTADRNHALAYFMREKGTFPEGTELEENLEFYFQCCSIELTAEAFSVMAATLARGGQCPITGVRVFDPENVKHCLSLMHSCGMYDFSGEFAFAIGLPSKSGVGGGLVMVIPNLMGLCIWSPPLDENGNSVRGIDFAKRLLDEFNFHPYDSLIGGQSKKSDPRVRESQRFLDGTAAICSAAAQGNLTDVRQLFVLGVDLNQGDYDGRTPLHLAASEGQEAVVHFLLDHGASASQKDRWGGTPLDDAKREGHKEVAMLLEAEMKR